MNTGRKIKIIVADDHPLIREGVRRLINKTQDLIVVADVENGQDALKAIDSLAPDVLILDLRMPEMDGFEVLKALKAKEQAPKVIILSADNDYLLIRYLLSEGAQAFCSKEQAPDLLVETIRRAVKVTPPQKARRISGKTFSAYHSV